MIGVIMNYGEPFDESELKVFIPMVAKERLIREYHEIVAELIKIEGMLKGVIPSDTMSE